KPRGKVRLGSLPGSGLRIYPLARQAVISLNPETICVGLYRDKFGVGRSNKWRAIVDENFTLRRMQINFQMPMNRVERLRLHGGERCVLFVMGVGQPCSSLSVRILGEHRGDGKQADGGKNCRSEDGKIQSRHRSFVHG